MSAQSAAGGVRWMEMLKNGLGAPLVVLALLAMIVVPLAPPVLDACNSQIQGMAQDQLFTGSRGRQHGRNTQAIHAIPDCFLVSIPIGHDHRQLPQRHPVQYQTGCAVTRFISHAGFSNAIGTVSGSTGTLAFDPDDWTRARVDVRVPLARVDLGDADWNKATLAKSLPNGLRGQPRSSQTDK